MLTLPFKFTKFIALSIALALLAQSFASAQDGATQTRPRRVQQETLPASPAPPAPPPPSEVAVARLGAEPQIRIGLSTNARSVTIWRC